MRDEIHVKYNQSINQSINFPDMHCGLILIALLTVFVTCCAEGKFKTVDRPNGTTEQVAVNKDGQEVTWLDPAVITDFEAARHLTSS